MVHAWWSTRDGPRAMLPAWCYSKCFDVRPSDHFCACAALYIFSMVDNPELQQFHHRTSVAQRFPNAKKIIWSNRDSLRTSKAKLAPLFANVSVLELVDPRSVVCLHVGLWRSNFIVTIAVLVAQPGLVHGTIVASFSQEWWQHEAFVFDARAGGLVNVMAV